VFQLQVTIITQTFQYMDMTCSVPQYGTVALNMSRSCAEMYA